MGNPIWAIFWLLVLIFISFIIAFFCSFIYIFLQVLAVCCPGLSSLNDLLLQGIQFPAYSARAALDGKSPL